MTTLLVKIITVQKVKTNSVNIKYTTHFELIILTKTRPLNFLLDFIVIDNIIHAVFWENDIN